MKTLICVMSLLAGLAVTLAQAAPAKSAKGSQLRTEKSSDVLAEGGIRRGTGFDVHGGAQFVMMDTNNSRANSMTDYGVGFMAGVGYESPLTVSLFLRPELNFVRKGTALATGTGENRSEGSLRADYLEIPAFVQAKLRRQDSMQMNFMAGPSLGVRLGAGGSSTTGSRSTEITASQMNLDTFDYGLQFGTGADVALGRDLAMLVSLRYSLGLANIAKDEGTEIKNQGFQVVTGVKF